MRYTNRHADYDQIARTYDQRYQRNPYTGVEFALKEFIGGQSGLRVLEVGCGTGHWLEKLQRPGTQLVGLDHSAGMLAQARKRSPRIDLIRGQAEQLPLPPVSFDRLFCINAIHHFTGKAAFFAEARRILRPGGRILTVGLDPHRGLDRWHVYDYFPESLTIDRQRYLSSQVLRQLMTEAGFEECVTREVEHWIIQLPAREILEQGRLEKAATSQLSVLTDEEYRHGIQRIRADMARLEAEGLTLFLIVDLRLYGTTGSVEEIPDE